MVRSRPRGGEAVQKWHNVATGGWNGRGNVAACEPRTSQRQPHASQLSFCMCALLVDLGPTVVWPALRHLAAGATRTVAFEATGFLFDLDLACPLALHNQPTSARRLLQLSSLTTEGAAIPRTAPGCAQPESTVPPSATGTFAAHRCCLAAIAAPSSSVRRSPRAATSPLHLSPRSQHLVLPTRPRRSRPGHASTSAAAMY